MVKLGKMFKKMLNNKNVLKVLLLVCVVVILMLMVEYFIIKTFIIMVNMNSLQQVRLI